MRNHAQREGRQPSADAPPTPSPEQIMAAKKEHIAKMIEENPDVKELIKTNPEEFKQTIKQNPQVEELFRGVDIDALSKNLNELSEEKPEEPQEPVVEDVTEHPNTDSQDSVKRPEVFLDEDPITQREKVFKYFEEKPKAKELLMNDIEKFKELLSMREDVQPIFENVNLDKLAEKLKEADSQKTDEGVDKSE